MKHVMKLYLPKYLWCLKSICMQEQDSMFYCYNMLYNVTFNLYVVFKAYILLNWNIMQYFTSQHCRNIAIMINTWMTYCLPSQYDFLKDITYVDNYAIIFRFINTLAAKKCAHYSPLLPTQNQSKPLFVWVSFTRCPYLCFYPSNILSRLLPCISLVSVVENTRILICLIVTYCIHYMSSLAFAYWVACWMHFTFSTDID